MRTVISILAGLVVIVTGYLIAVNLWPSGRGSIVVISDPPGAQVWIDLEATNVVTDGMVTRIPRGKHSVTVKLDTLMADPFAQIVEVRRGKPDTVRFTLRPPLHQPWAGATPGASPMDRMTELNPIPTAADVRGSPLRGDSSQAVSPSRAAPDSQTHVTSDPLLPTKPPPATPSAASPQAGVIAVSASQPGAAIFLNDRQLDERTPANIAVPFGTYTIHAELEGYHASPDEQSVRITRAAASQSVHFTLEKSPPPARAIRVETTPVEGRIFVDSLFTGEGQAAIERDFGTYVVTFGDVEGWRKPDPIRVTLTPSSPTDSVTGTYVRLFHAFAQVNGPDNVALEGVKNWSGGIIFEPGKPHLSGALGPKITAIPDATDRFGWELGMGDPNRNPTGGDYVAILFSLPGDVPSDTPLNLRLYVYKSSRRFPFSLSSRSVIAVEVNGRHFLDGFSPRNSTSAVDEGRFEEWSLRNALKPGENQILVYTGNGNSVMNYLWRIEIQ